MWWSSNEKKTKKAKKQATQLDEFVSTAAKKIDEVSGVGSVTDEHVDDELAGMVKLSVVTGRATQQDDLAQEEQRQTRIKRQQQVDIEVEKLRRKIVTEKIELDEVVKAAFRTMRLTPDATPEEVRERYKSFAKRLHPDKFKDDEKRNMAIVAFQKLNEAYKILKGKGLSL